MSRIRLLYMLSLTVVVAVAGCGPGKPAGHVPEGPVVEDGKTVLFHVRIVSGDTVLEDTFGGEPWGYVQGTVGKGFLFKDYLAGRKIGDVVDIKFNPLLEWNYRKIVQMMKSAFPEETRFALGEKVVLEIVPGRKMEGVIIGMMEDSVLVDFNNSLAGRKIHFYAQIVDIRPSSKAPV